MWALACILMLQVGWVESTWTELSFPCRLFSFALAVIAAGKTSGARITFLLLSFCPEYIALNMKKEIGIHICILFSKFSSLARMCLKVYCYRFFLLIRCFQPCRLSYSNTSLSLLFKYRSLVHLELILCIYERWAQRYLFLMTIQALRGAFWIWSADGACRWGCPQGHCRQGWRGVRDRGSDLMVRIGMSKRGDEWDWQV